MRFIAAFQKAGALLVAGAWLSACGGGGGGGNAAPAPQPTATTPPASSPPPVSDPPSTLLSLNEANAEDALAIVLAGMDQAVAAAEVAQFAVNIVQGGRPRLTFCGIATIHAVTARLVDRDASGGLTAADTIDVSSEACSGLTHTVTLEVTAADSAAGTAEGSLSFDGQLDDEDVIDGTASFSVSSNGPETVVALTDLSFTFTRDGIDEQFSGVDLQKTRYDGSLYEIDFSGTLDSPSLGGQVDFDTDDILSGEQEALPFRGRLSLSGDASQLRVTANRGADTADYELDADGVLSKRPVDWESRLQGLMFGLRTSGLLLTTSLQLQPHYPTATTNDLRGIFRVIDFPFDLAYAEYEWRRNGELIAGQITELLPASEFAKGDLIELTARAADGNNSVVLTAATRIVNSLPVIEDPVIAPAAAYTTDDLHFAETITDPDGDSLAISYVWQRNGETVDGQTGSVLPASEHVRDDLIMASVNVDDGSDIVTGEATITILDSPPVVSVDPPSDPIAAGDPVSFPVTLLDPDDDPTDGVPLRIAYGPAGMSVDSAAHTVSYTPDEPMFTDTLDLRFGVAVATPDGAAASGTLHIEDPGRPDVLARTGLDGPAVIDGLLVGDFNGDGSNSALLLTDTLYELAYDTETGAYGQTWVYPFYLGRLWSFTAGDVDGDGHYELYVAADDRLIKLDGVTRRPVDSIAIDEQCSDLEYGDLDADGVRDELVCSFPVFSGMTSLGASYLVLDAADLSEIYRTPPGDYGYGIEIGNVDGDFENEIVTNLGYVVDGVSFAVERPYADGLGSKFALGDVDGDAVDEVFCICAGSLIGYREGTQFWQVDYADNALGIADVDGDNDMEVLGDFHLGGSALRAYDFPDAGAPTPIFEVSAVASDVRVLDASDFDADGTVEVIGIGGGGGLPRFYVYGSDTAAEEWSANRDYALLGPFIGGQPTVGAGPEEQALLFLTNSDYTDATRLISLSPDDGRVVVSGELSRYFDANATLNVTDYDDDGYSEVFLSVLGILSAYDLRDASVSWTGSSVLSRETAAADLTGDGRDDFVTVGPSAGTTIIEVHDVWNDTLVSIDTLSSAFRNVRLVDFDGDGNTDIVGISDAGIEVYERVAPDVFESTLTVDPGVSVGDLEIGDLDGDGRLEVVFPSRVSAFGYAVHVLDAGLEPIRQFDLDFVPADLSIERSGHARKNLIFTSAVRGSTSDAGTVVIGIDSTTGAEVWRSPTLLGTPWRNNLKVFERDNGARSIVLGTRQGMYVTQ